MKEFRVMKSWSLTLKTAMQEIQYFPRMIWDGTKNPLRKLILPRETYLFYMSCNTWPIPVDYPNRLVQILHYNTNEKYFERKLKILHPFFSVVALCPFANGSRHSASDSHIFYLNVGFGFSFSKKISGRIRVLLILLIFIHK